VSHILIDNYYCAVLSCITNSALYALPTRKLGSAHAEYVVPGWNEIVSDKHKDAREAFLAWAELGKPKQGMELVRMQQSRAAFKLALDSMKYSCVLMNLQIA